MMACWSLFSANRKRVQPANSDRPTFVLEASSHFGGAVLVALVRQLRESAHCQFSDRPIFMLEASGHLGEGVLVALLRQLSGVNTANSLTGQSSCRGERPYR